LQYNNARDNCINIYINLLKTNIMQELDKFVYIDYDDSCDMP